MKNQGCGVRRVAVLAVLVGLASACAEPVSLAGDTDAMAPDLGSTQAGGDADVPMSESEADDGSDLDGGSSTGELGDDVAEGTTGADATTGTDDGDPSAGGGQTCVEDDYEDNDSVAFPAFWDGRHLGAMSCDVDLDVFQVDPALDDRNFLMQQPTGDTPDGERFADLVLELYCGQALCDIDDSALEWTTVSADACACDPQERLFVAVRPEGPGNPDQGTRYALTLP